MSSEESSEAGQISSQKVAQIIENDRNRLTVPLEIPDFLPTTDAQIESLMEGRRNKTNCPEMFPKLSPNAYRFLIAFATAFYRLRNQAIVEYNREKLKKQIDASEEIISALYPPDKYPHRGKKLTPDQFRTLLYPEGEPAAEQVKVNDLPDVSLDDLGLGAPHPEMFIKTPNQMLVPAGLTKFQDSINLLIQPCAELPQNIGDFIPASLNSAYPEENTIYVLNLGNGASLQVFPQSLYLIRVVRHGETQYVSGHSLDEVRADYSLAGGRDPARVVEMFPDETYIPLFITLKSSTWEFEAYVIGNQITYELTWKQKGKGRRSYEYSEPYADISRGDPPRDSAECEKRFIEVCSKLREARSMTTNE